MESVAATECSCCCSVGGDRSAVVSLHSELHVMKNMLRDSQIYSEKLKTILKKNLKENRIKNSDAKLDRSVSGGLKKVIEERDECKNKLLHLEDELSFTNSQLFQLKSDLKLKNRQLFKSQTYNAKNTLKLSLMFLRMKVTKQNIESKRSKYEQMCAELIMYMKEQSDLMKYVTENAHHHDAEMANCGNILELLQRFSWLLFENSKLRYKISAHSCLDECSSKTPEKAKQKNHSIAVQNFEESTLILNKLKQFERIELANQMGGSSMSLNGSETTIFNQENNFSRRTDLNASKSVLRFLPY